MSAQDDDVPLGDLARQLRGSKQLEKSEVIDNDNFALMMDKAESKRLEGKPIFSVSPSGKSFTAVSLDGTCSLSFDAKSANRTSAAFIASDLPQDELLKLTGPATIQDGTLQVSVHNGTQWELKEIVVGMTVPQTATGPEYRTATLDTSSAPAGLEKDPDLTVLYHLKGSATPDATAVFRGSLGGNFSDGRDWHWAIIGARGIPPAAPATTSKASAVIDPASAPLFGNTSQLGAAAKAGSDSSQVPTSPGTNLSQP